jgi:uncharacterized PurR-regulated membrane protein YhhQ (DUF165 family)
MEITEILQARAAASLAGSQLYDNLTFCLIAIAVMAVGMVIAFKWVFPAIADYVGFLANRVKEGYRR